MGVPHLTHCGRAELASGDLLRAAYGKAGFRSILLHVVQS
jgi:hypothetical protein